VTLTITVRINGTGSIGNVANVSIDQTNDGNSSANSSDVYVPAVNLTITKTSSVTGNVSVGTEVVYTITVTNSGPDTGHNVVVWDVLDSRLVFITYSASAGTGVYNPVNGQWNVGTLNIGQTVQLNITVRIEGTGTIRNVANVTVDEYNHGNNSTNGNNSTVNVPASVNLTVTKNSNVTAPVIIGDYVLYTITVRNSGPDNATGLVIIDLLDPRLSFISYSASLGTYVSSNGRWTIGNLNVGQTVEINITVRINGTGAIPNVATVTVNQDNLGDNNASSLPLNADRIPTIIQLENITQNATMPFNINGTVSSAASGWIVNGFVNITINGTVYRVPVVNGRFNLSLTYNQYGLYDNLTVEFFGDATFGNSSTNGWLNILPLATTITVDTITNNISAFIVNYPTNLTAHLLDQFGRPVVGAIVSFIVDGVTIGTATTNANGIAIYSFTPTVIGAFYTIEVIYAGNSVTYLGSNDIISRQSREVATRIIIDNVTTKPFRTARIGVTLVDEFGTPMPGKYLEISIDGQNQSGTTDHNGKVYLTYNASEAGNVRIDAEFPASPGFMRSDQIGVLTVEKLITNIQLKNVIVTAAEDASFSATLVDEDGRLLQNMTIDVYIDGEFIGTFTSDSFGKIYVGGISLPTGLYTVQATFAGYGNIWDNTSSLSTIKVRPLRTSITVSANQDPNKTSTTFVARLIDEFNKPLAKKLIVFYLDGNFIGIAETDNNGIARLPYSYVPGGRIVAEFLGDGIYGESLDNRLFGISSLPNDTNRTNSTNNTNGTDPDPKVLGSDDEDNGNDIRNGEPTPALAMLTTGNPIAMVLLCLLSVLLLGFRRRRKK
jgi:uncharacterized repeat protein (TIGR01451 family)